MTLDMSEYMLRKDATAAGGAEEQKGEARPSSQGRGSPQPGPQDRRRASPKSRPDRRGAEPPEPPAPAGQVYELVGVVIHEGTADSGHYYSLIKDRGSDGESWITFNDTKATPTTPEKFIEANAFGRKGSTGSAYILVYEAAAAALPAPA
eukprot:CAMPEP_0118870528 /NCGR_PEP_ID=MMETSP1163-20130328/13461_1 /TAXON_ID=124430 /ORGANISM="Phaeomonas parva, Strain CCMP2877" /LENGTH=149 /DNA_ID=CAMNT_0006805541 /DNA_START=103 /DNA_END=549 /DNA_ORIENTATION=+